MAAAWQQREQETVKEIWERCGNVRQTGNVECLAERLGDVLQQEVEFREEITTGWMNRSGIFELKRNGEELFLKYDNRRSARRRLAAEAHAMQRISATNTLRLPKLIGHFDDPRDENGCLLVEEAIQVKERQASRWDCRVWEELGNQLGALHADNGRKIARIDAISSVHCDKNESDLLVREFGLHEDTYHGTFRIAAAWKPSWAEYFAQIIMEPLMRLIERDCYNEYSASQKELWSELRLNLHKCLPSDGTIKPSLIHGDFHHGNLLLGKDGVVAFDVGGYYAHANFDMSLALEMKHVSGWPDPGIFSEEFFKAYERHMPRSNLSTRLTLYKVFVQAIFLFVGEHVGLAELERALGVHKKLKECLVKAVEETKSS